VLTLTERDRDILFSAKRTEIREVRCPVCNLLLLKACGYGTIEAKCGRCKQIHIVKL